MEHEQDVIADWTFDELDGKILHMIRGRDGDHLVLIGYDEIENKSYLLALEDLTHSGKELH